MATTGTITAHQDEIFRVGILQADEGVSFDGLAPPSSPLLFTGITLADSCNLIRGISIAPTRASGWIAFSGTVGATPAQVYTDYRELHTNGVAEVLGFGAFPFMDSGASCASMFAVQAICEVDTGSTVLTAGGDPGKGIFPLNAKLLIDNATVNSGAQAAAIRLSTQINVVDVHAELVSAAYIENASGQIRDVLYLKSVSGASWVNFFSLSTEVAPVIAWGGDNDPKDSTPDKGLRIMVGSTEYQIPLYINT
jgi:hypothetical protein